MTKLQQAADHIKAQLNWVGPNGKVQGIITLPRALAIAVRELIEQNSEGQMKTMQLTLDTDWEVPVINNIAEIIRSLAVTNRLDGRLEEFLEALGLMLAGAALEKAAVDELDKLETLARAAELVQAGTRMIQSINVRS